MKDNKNNKALILVSFASIARQNIGHLCKEMCSGANEDLLKQKVSSSPFFFQNYANKINKIYKIVHFQETPPSSICIQPSFLQSRCSYLMLCLQTPVMSGKEVEFPKKRERSPHNYTDFDHVFSISPSL